MPPRVLIIGAGVAGSTLATLLSPHASSILLIDRSASQQTAGQGIDIEVPALDIVTNMGLLDAVKAKTTREEGAAVVDEQNRACGTFDVADGGVTLTRSIEIMRGDLVEVLLEKVRGCANVEIRFETGVSGLRQSEKKVFVELQGKNDRETTTEEFDIVVGADGVNSRARKLALGSSDKLKCLKPVGCFIAFFSIKSLPQDWPRARLCQFPGRRTLTIRPHGEQSPISSVYMGQFKDTNPALIAAQAERDNGKAKAAFADLFQGLGWETKRVVEEMLKSDNFYFDRLMQVKLAKWYEGRVVLLGDAAYAPSPLTGKGTALAILGAYVLAQEVARKQDDMSGAFEAYEKRLRRYVEDAQNIPLYGYAPYLLNPESSWGIWLFRTIASFVSWSGLAKLLPDIKSAEFDLEIEKGKG
ncbi:hypothetical protein H2200_004494 [Cladophialophora chaetospira]|uniref:FAD-binding domain-containing protein n=1 Tax=Cladophialophora chaetospira TaxID=386627 RepID=A0AA38XDC6_9EURO|nr:hypothetical protein H2200_004494 [Cladophialophora chaetospira]